MRRETFSINMLKNIEGVFLCDTATEFLHVEKTTQLVQTIDDIIRVASEFAGEQK